MSPKSDDPQFPHDKDELLRDFYLHGRMKDIRDAIELRDRLAPKWWETLIGIAQFGAALGLIASLFFLQRSRGDDLTVLILLWLTVFVITLVFGIEFLIFKLHHMRRANEISIRLIKTLSDRVDELEKHAPKAPAEEKHTEKTPEAAP